LKNKRTLVILTVKLNKLLQGGKKARQRNNDDMMVIETQWLQIYELNGRKAMIFVSFVE
jgi:hypothetical protein